MPTGDLPPNLPPIGVCQHCGSNVYITGEGQVHCPHCLVNAQVERDTFNVDEAFQNMEYIYWQDENMEKFNNALFTKEYVGGVVDELIAKVEQRRRIRETNLKNTRFEFIDLDD